MRSGTTHAERASGPGVLVPPGGSPCCELCDDWPFAFFLQAEGPGVGGLDPTRCPYVPPTSPRAGTDPRTNTGDDLWPILAGIGPVLGGGHGRCVRPARRQQWLGRVGGWFETHALAQGDVMSRNSTQTAPRVQMLKCRVGSGRSGGREVSLRAPRPCLIPTSGEPGPGSCAHGLSCVSVQDRQTFRSAPALDRRGAPPWQNSQASSATSASSWPS